MSVERQPASWPFPALSDCQDERVVPRRCGNPECALCYESPRDIGLIKEKPRASVWAMRLVWGAILTVGAALWACFALTIWRAL